MRMPSPFFFACQPLNILRNSDEDISAKPSTKLQTHDIRPTRKA